MNWELPDVQGEFRKGRGTRDQIANIRWTIEKAREFQKNIYFCFIDYAKTFECVDHNKLWKILKEKGIPEYLTCLLRNLYAGQEATVRTGHGSALLTTPKPLTVWFPADCGKFWKRWEYQTTWSDPWETYTQVRKQQLELDMEQQTGSK